MDNVNHLNELSIQSQLSTLEKLVAISKLSLVPYSRNMELQTYK